MSPTPDATTTVTRFPDETAVTRAVPHEAAAGHEARTVVAHAFPPYGAPGASPHLAARIVAGAGPARAPIRYDPAPGAPRGEVRAMWGPPIPVAGG